MIFQSQKMQLKSIRVILKNEINELHVCKNLNDKGGGLYTVICVKDHTYVRRFLTVCETTQSTENFFVDCFSCNDDQIIVFPYVKERPLFSFYRPDILSLSECEDLCINIIIACMSSGLPWPILYLILTQEQLHMSRDNSVYLGFAIDLSKLESDRTERDCTIACAKLLMRILDPKAGKGANSLKLLDKKSSKQSYVKFMELYKDIRISAAPREKQGVWFHIKQWFLRNRDRLFRVLLWISIILAIFVVLSFISQLIFGDVPWLRIFINSFEQIGTENLRQ